MNAPGLVNIEEFILDTIDKLTHESNNQIQHVIAANHATSEAHVEISAKETINSNHQASIREESRTINAPVREGENDRLDGMAVNE
jgi:hypothetical protein